MKALKIVTTKNDLLFARVIKKDLTVSRLKKLLELFPNNTKIIVGTDIELDFI